MNEDVRWKQRFLNIFVFKLYVCYIDNLIYG